MIQPQSKPLFSIITACYNAADTIQETIDSVASQVGVSFEHIIIDGGSTDDTMKIIAAQRERFSAVISESDKGVYDAMGKGLKLARGRYTGFLNADDYFASEDVLNILAQPLKTDETLGGLTAMVEQIDDNHRVKRVIGKQPFDPIDLLWGRFPPHPATYLETARMNAVGGFDPSYKISGDFDMLLRVWCQIQQSDNVAIGHVNEVIVKMRLGGISTKGSPYILIGTEMLHALKKSGYRPSPFKIWTRAIRKLPEILLARLLRR